MPSIKKKFNWLDRCLIEIQQGLASITNSVIAERPYPNPSITSDAPVLSKEQTTLAGRLLRVNHSGEICAQALYQGQAITCKNPVLRQQLQQSAKEEQDHLAWCYTRIKQLHTHTSYLNPIWYLGSFTLGACVGILGDRWNLGFLVETERQVVNHLTNHLQRLPAEDSVSQSLLIQMRNDEAMHADKAYRLGAAILPPPIPYLMRYSAKLMTSLAYWI